MVVSHFLGGFLISVSKTFLVEMATKKVKCHTATLDTALHVLKGALVKTFETPLTVSVTYRNAKQARLVVHWTRAEGPSDDEVRAAERLTNDTITQNVPVRAQAICSCLFLLGGAGQ